MAINRFVTYSIPPVRLRYLDGSSSTINRKLRLLIRFPSGEVHLQDFFVTRLDSPCDMVMGYNWLQCFNPLIDWKNAKIAFRTTDLKEGSSSTPLAKMSVSVSVAPVTDKAPPVAVNPSGLSTPIGSKLPDPGPSMDVPGPSMGIPAPSMETSAPPVYPGRSRKPSGPSRTAPKASPPSPSRQAPHISIVGAAAFRTIIKDPETCQYTLRASQLEDLSARAASVDAPDLSGLPSTYHDFADVFSERSAYNLAPHREFDLKIETIDGAVPPIGHVYSLSANELTALRKFLDENLKAGFIYPSTSSHGAPILFAKKKDGSLRLCVDYRGLNLITKKDRYPLPLISDLLDAPGKARIYTKLDLRHAYHLLRIAPGDEWKTAFRSRYGSYEFKVVPEGLANAPAAFQRFLNTVFADMLDVNVIVYLDDILVYSDDPADHESHVREVLRRLRKHGLFCKLPKCEFNVTTCEYLGYILSPDGFRMSPEKISAVVDWPTPRKVKDVQSFLGFCNFYRRFIYAYSDITIPLTRLTRNSVRWDWNSDCQLAFNTLKEKFKESPVLSHWIPDRQITVETDASDYAIASILSVTGDDGEIHPVAFRSRTLGSAELNYDTHDKELLAIFDAFSAWRHYLEGSGTPIDVVTDHKNLEYFATTKVLTRRQVRWSEYLCRFNMVIRFRPGKLGGKPDALTRRWDVYPKEGDTRYTELNPQNFRPIFTQEQLQSSLRATFLEEIVFRASIVMDVEQLHADIKAAVPQDPLGVSGLTSAASGNESRWTLDASGMLRYDKRIWVPSVPGDTPDELRVRVCQYLHDHMISGHFGQNRTLAIVRREYTWPELRKFVKGYCKSCVLCKRNKAPRHRPYGLLRPLPVPLRPWDSISMDFIEQLPQSGEFDAILVIVDRASKQVILIPCDIHITSVQLAELFLIHVFSKHGVPSHVTCDRGKEFISAFFRSLGELLKMKMHYTSGYHPSADGQTERMNQTVEQYIRIYCSYQQDDWDKLLPLCEFALNNAPNASTGISPFFANKGYDPSIRVHPEVDAANAHARNYVVNLDDLHVFLREQLTYAQQRYKITGDRVRSPDPVFNIGDQVFVTSKYLTTTRPTRKFSELLLGPYEVIGKPSAASYQIRLPKSLAQVHPVFHVSQLEPHTPNPFPGREEPPPAAVEIIDGDEHFEVKQIVDSKIDRRFKNNKLRYYVEWLGYENTDDQYSWLGSNDIDAPEHIQDFHIRFPNKPGPEEPA